ncbi:MAG: hypothetical protein PVH85_04765 [Desulfobacterales bacterium]|jgi:hypothetical protein
MLKIIFCFCALLPVFSIYSVASADDIFKIEAEGSYRMEDGSSIDLARKMAPFSANRQAVDLAGR